MPFYKADTEFDAANATVEGTLGKQGVYRRFGKMLPLT